MRTIALIAQSNSTPVCKWEQQQWVAAGADVHELEAGSGRSALHKACTGRTGREETGEGIVYIGWVFIFWTQLGDGLMGCV